MDSTRTFHEVMRWTDQESRAFLERLRWPDGPQCPKCGAAEPYTITRKSPSKNAVRSFYKCRGCKRQFTATVGTIFEDSKIPLHKWAGGHLPHVLVQEGHQRSPAAPDAG